MILKKALLLSGLAIATAPVQAETLTYTFFTVGSGSAYGFPGVLDPYTPLTLTDAKFLFTVDTSLMFSNGRGGTDLFGSMVNGYADASGLEVYADQDFGSLAFNGGASVCFANPGGGFITTPTRIESTCRSGISASGYGSTNGFFNYAGVVTGLEVSVGGGSIVTQVVNGVPEPSTWALMLAGFGMVGYAMRRRKVAFA
jgi:hypothetical protein